MGRYMFAQVAASYFMPFSLTCLGCLARFRTLILADTGTFAEQYKTARAALRDSIVDLRVSGTCSAGGRA